MAHTERATIHNANRMQAHGVRSSRKPAQRAAHKIFRQSTRRAIANGFEAPVMRRGVDRVVC